MKTFKCKFNDLVSCEVMVPESPPKTPNDYCPTVQWTGKPNQKMLAPYIAWMNSVNKELSDSWGVSFMYIFMLGPSIGQIWTYSPGSPPKIMMKKRGSLC